MLPSGLPLLRCLRHPALLVVGSRQQAYGLGLSVVAGML